MHVIAYDCLKGIGFMLSQNLFLLQLPHKMKLALKVVKRDSKKTTRFLGRSVTHSVKEGVENPKKKLRPLTTGYIINENCHITIKQLSNEPNLVWGTFRFCWNSLSSSSLDLAHNPSSIPVENDLDRLMETEAGIGKSFPSSILPSPIWKKNSIYGHKSILISSPWENT